MQPSRRNFLRSTAALGAASLMPPSRSYAVEDRRQLVVATRTIEVGGKAATVFGIEGQPGVSGIVLGPDERFDVTLDNQTGEETIVHWHGQVPAPELDGVADTGYVSPLAAMAQRDFDFAPRPGTHWMHSHHGLQEQRLLAAPLIVRTTADLSADQQEVIVLLHDFTFRDPDEILKQLTGSSSMDHGAMGADPTEPMNMQIMDDAKPTAPMTMPAMDMADLNDVAYDAYLANDRTLDDPMVVTTERGGRVRLRIINGATSTAFWLDFGGAQATVIAADGNAVAPVKGTRFPMAQAQRLDILVDVPAAGVVPVFAQREGDRARTGIILAAPGATIGKYASEADAAAEAVDLSLESRLVALSPLAARAADVRHSVMLAGSMSPYSWTIDNLTFANRRKLIVKQGQRVELEFMNHSMMAHPIHLHGHHFQVVSLDGNALAGAMRDTVLVPSMGAVKVAFDADNPGRWLFHCHNLYHMAAGMMSEVVYEGSEQTP